MIKFTEDKICQCDFCKKETGLIPRDTMPHGWLEIFVNHNWIVHLCPTCSIGPTILETAGKIVRKGRIR